MKNMLVAKILSEIADLLEMEDVEFKPRAYRKAARSVEALSKPIEQVSAEGKLNELPGVGANIAKKIVEIIETGSLKYHEELMKRTPIDLEDLLSVEGIGPKTVKLLYTGLGVKSLDDLERAARLHKIRVIKGLGSKTEENIIASIQLARSKKERVLLGSALPIAEMTSEGLKEAIAADGSVIKVEVAGSLRRMKETIGDIDILATCVQPRHVLDIFAAMRGVRKVLDKGETKCSVLLEDNMQVDLRVVEEKSFGSALMYFTGSKDHNIAMRRIAMEKGYKLNEYGLFNDTVQVAGRTEEEVYKHLDLDYIPPELREDHGEIEAAKKHGLPHLIRYGAIKGDLHTHTKWSDGLQTIEQMAQAAEDIGYSYIAITDHYSRMKIARGLTEPQLRNQMKQIDQINEKLSGIRVMKGAEIDIRKDGSLDARKELLKELDVVVASVHGTFKQTKKEMTDRIISAMESGHVDVIGHPTSRKIDEKKPCEIDMERVFETSKRTQTYLEINSQPQRLDLDDANVRSALEFHCKLAVNTDAHNHKQLKNIRLGVAVARRGWAEAEDIINTQPLNNLMKTLRES